MKQTSQFTMSSVFGNYFTVKENKRGQRISGFQTFVAYLGGSAFQTVMDNPVTAYRQLVQQCVCARRRMRLNLALVRRVKQAV